MNEITDTDRLNWLEHGGHIVQEWAGYMKGASSEAKHWVVFKFGVGFIQTDNIRTAIDLLIRKENASN